MYDIRRLMLMNPAWYLVFFLALPFIGFGIVAYLERK